ncbi:hypothetical protein KL905_004288 [Ogataea polymorpha]|uniref:GPI-anchored wall transfer protein n=1 Tax=Ogataea polymorpha TaxID=460523 RepID=A0A9P8NT75_9ASCO|nr:hypothetical protein KL935_005405 [Ogataea polymorpha]KAG7900603.1 hypothetical protein KL907_004721 [Ogataea polymorpha]KAG7906134.1 hypothetical protein KL906_004587 [Ogataea polymorpha]KAG7917268.1 hypothetical protein KL905_004288 [Ogataea polymorpha]KAH3659110.1 hypothetical protein OGATHE_006370 [Ogataea polymorpha]
MSASLKERKEEFVTGLKGGSTIDIYGVTSVSIVSYLVWSILKKKTSVFNDSNDVQAIVLDFLINWVLLLLSVTCYCDNVTTLIAASVIPLLLIVFRRTKEPSGKTTKINLDTLSSKQFTPFITYVTVYRAQMMIITCICILAVDFPVFPRRFAKVETWGTSLMDLGVGSFVFSMGLVSARQNIRQRFDSKYSYFKNLITSIKNSIPLLILGAIRLSSVKFFDYQEHITEYGKHWNFFFTLCLIPLIANVFAPIINLLSPIVTGFSIMLLYEVVLTKFGLLEYILNSQREGLIGMNKEGLFSLAGYLAIYLNGISLGYIIFPLFPTRKNSLTVSGSKDQCLNNRKIYSFSVSPTRSLFILATLFHALYYVLDTCYIYGVSRRMANALYVIWVCAYNYTFLFGYKLVENLVWGEPRYELTHSETRITVANDNRNINCVPMCLRAVNYNGLTIFILANVLTGLINLTFNTIDTSDTIALVILIAYCAVLFTVAFFLYTREIHIR